jgi:hypothetical protein
MQHSGGTQCNHSHALARRVRTWRVLQYEEGRVAKITHVVQEVRWGTCCVVVVVVV